MKKVSAVSTTNVLEIINEFPQQIFSFPDNKKGNKDAESLFKQIAKEHGAKKKDMDSYIKNGTFVLPYYQVCLMHSV